MPRFLFCILIIPTIIACNKATEELAPPPVRAVKTLVISEASRANSRQISGVVKTSKESELSFRVGGRVTSVNVKAGTSVTKGMVLATLDTKSYKLSTKEAQARLSNTRSNFKEKKDSLDRQNSLFEQGFVARVEVDKAQAAFNSASSEVKIAKTQLKLNQNDQGDTVLRAPFSGKIAKRMVDPFVVVSSGNPVFILQSGASKNIEALIPETLIRELSYGDVVRVSFPTLKNTNVGGTVIEIGARAESGNAFPVKIKLGKTSADIRAGMTAQVTFNFGQSNSPSVFLIPVSAIDMRVPETPDGDPNQKSAPVFIFNKEKQIAEKRVVQIRDVRGNKLEVVNGLKAGDVLIVAGAPFLTEGQKVKLWQPTNNLPAKLNLQK
jgi:multidrug efflux system membrane fusion protein